MKEKYFNEYKLLYLIKISKLVAKLCLFKVSKMNDFVEK